MKNFIRVSKKTEMPTKWNFAIDAKSIIQFFLLAWFAHPLYAQDIKYLSPENGLSSSLVNYVFQDRDGFIWVATEDGLGRYDGIKINTFYPSSQPNSIKNDFVKCLCEDPKGHLLIGLANGLQVFDKSTDSFFCAKQNSAKGNDFIWHVKCIVVLQNGEVLVGTSGKGVFKLRFHQDTPCMVQDKRFGGDLKISSIYEDKLGRIWVATDDEGLLVNERPKNKKSPTHLTNEYNISTFCEDANGQLYAGSLTNGLLRYDRETGKFIRIIHPQLPHLPIKKLYLDKNNQLLIGTDGNGLWNYSPQTNEFKLAITHHADFNITKSKIHSIIRDRNGNLWLGIYQKGVLLETSEVNPFEYIGYRSVDKNAIGSCSVMSLSLERNGNIWVGTDNDGIYLITPNGKQLKHYSHSAKSESVPATALHLHEDSQNRLWIGSYLNGICMLHTKTGKCQNIYNTKGGRKEEILRVFDLFEDRQGNIWAGTLGTGLFFIDGKTTEATQLSIELSGSWVNCLRQSRLNGNIYIGTLGGLRCINPSNRKKVYFGNQDRLLAKESIQTIYEASDGILWIGTLDALYKYDIRKNNMQKVYKSDKLPNKRICGIEEDGEGNLWITTLYTILRYDKKKQKIKNYFSYDKLKVFEFGRASLKYPDGNIYFGGVNGISYFTPQRIRDNRESLNVYVTGVYVRGQVVRKGTFSSRNEHQGKDTHMPDTFRLAYNDNDFSIEFSTLSFNHPDKITYQYAMNGKQWAKLDFGSNKLTFSHLPPGSYHLSVQANDNNILSEPKEIVIIISHPWYSSSSAWICYMILMILLVYATYWQIKKKVRRKEKILKYKHKMEMNEAKLRFFINISHEIRTPLSLIINPLNKLIKSDTEASRQEDYTTMYRNSQRILQLINQLMDIRKIEKGLMDLHFKEIEIIPFVNDLYNLFASQAREKHIDFSFHHPEEKLKVWIDAQHFDKIVLNILSNAFKFTPEYGRITISMQQLDNNLVIAISDTGPGIPDEEKKRIFERFYQINNAVNRSQLGTGVGLNLAYSLIKLHQGTIKVKDGEGGGSCFEITIPLGKTHLKPEQTTIDTDASAQPAEAGPIINDYQAATAGKRVQSRFRVLIVEDDAEIRHYVKHELGSKYHTMEASDGKTALDLMTKQMPDIIISDVMMPGMDGGTLCKKIKKNVNTNHIPVVLLTAMTKDEDRIQGLESGADAYIEKPFNIEVLKSTIENLLFFREMLRNKFTGRQMQEESITKIDVKTQDEKLMERISKVINENLSDPKLNVEFIAEKVGVSRVHLHRKMKEITSLCPSEFVKNHRLKQAAEMLRTKQIDVSTVAYAVGFSYPNTFSTCFKEMYGVSPKEYMKQNKNDGSDEKKSDDPKKSR